MAYKHRIAHCFSESRNSIIMDCGLLQSSKCEKKNVISERESRSGAKVTELAIRHVQSATAYNEVLEPNRN